MAQRRRRRGFEQAASCSPDQLGLSSKASRALRLAVAWRDVAGTVLAGRAEAVRVSRGTLEVQVDERRWEVTVRALLPRLGARLSRRYPALGVRRCRLLVEEGDSVRRGEAVALEAVEPHGEPKAPVPRKVPDEPSIETPPTPDDLAERLARVGDRYLARAEQRQIRKRSGPGPAKPSDPR